MINSLYERCNQTIIQACVFEVRLSYNGLMHRKNQEFESVVLLSQGNFG